MESTGLACIGFTKSGRQAEAIECWALPISLGGSLSRLDWICKFEESNYGHDVWLQQLFDLFLSSEQALAIAMPPNQMPSDPEKRAWRSYEELAEYLLNRMAKEFGFERVEGKQEIQGKRSGTSWEIDAKGIIEGSEGFFIVECRRYTQSRQNQEKAGGLAYRVLDSGADGAILVSPMGLQEGAQKIAAAENIICVLLPANSTATDFVIQFFNKICIGMTMKAEAKMSVTPRLVRACAQCGTTYPKDEHPTLCSNCR